MSRPSDHRRAGGSRSGRRPAELSRPLASVRTAGYLLATAAAGLWMLAFLAPQASASNRAPGGSAVASPSSKAAASSACPGGDFCATIPAECPTGTTCPEVTVAPASDLGSGQWVTISARNFPPEDSLALNFCSNKVRLSTGPPVCMVQGTSVDPTPAVVLTVFPDGTTSLSYAVQEDEDDGNPALTGKIPGTQTTGSFFCDNQTNPCAIVVTDPSLGSSAGNPTPSLQNSAVIPVTFASSGVGCPKATFVTTQSEFGFDRIPPVVAQYDCTGKQPAVPINTAQDSVAAVTGLVGGADEVAFIDEPEAASVKSVLAPLKGHYALVPIALSANVVGFKAIMDETSTNRTFPDNALELTPNMVAGLVTNYYFYVTLSDVANCGTAYGGQCSVFSAINQVNGFRPPADFGGYVRSDSSSTTGELFDWLCSAHNAPVPLPLGGDAVETETASQVLVAGLQGGHASVTSCPSGVDQFPSLVNLTYWVSVNVPAQQSLKLSGLVPPPNIPSPTGSTDSGFAPMNWSEANYYGLNPAGLQNASGHFVLPTETSLDAAVADGIKNPDGTISPDFATTDPAAYPLPDLWYAVVPTKTRTPSDAAAVSTMLRAILDVTGGSQAVDLPPGFVPLPTALYDSAEADVAKDVVAGKPTPPVKHKKTTRPPTPAGGTTPATSGSTTPAGQGTGTGPASGTRHGVAPHKTAPSSKKTSAKSASPPATRPAAKPAARFPTDAFDVFGHSLAWLLPTFVSAAAAAFLFGPTLLMLARRRAKVTG